MKKVDSFKIVRDILGGQWLVNEPESIFSFALDYLGKIPLKIDVPPTKVQAFSSSGKEIEFSKETEETKTGKVAVLPLKGIMTKYGTCYSDGTLALSSILKSFADDYSIAGVVLDIDSGGGDSQSVPPLIESINYFKSTGKPIVAHCDICASAAYWVASQCNSIYMDNVLSRVGSIGAMACIVDNRASNPTTGAKLITVYAKESADKNKAYREALEGKYTLLQDELSPLVQEFHSSVISGRPTLQKDAKGVLSGAMFYPSEAIKLGLADAIKTLSDTIETVFALSEIS